MKKRILFLLALYFMWLPLLAIQKPVFMLYHHALASGCSLIDYLKVITHGLLLDCTIAGYLTTLPLLMTLVSVWLPGSFYRKLLKGYFGIMAVLIAAIFSVDVALYGYWGFRLDATLFFYLQSPGDAMASVPLGQFFAQLLMFAVYAFGIYWVLKRFIVPLFPETLVRKRYHYPVRRDTLHSDTRRRNDFDGERGDGIFQPKPIPQPFGNQSLFQPDRFT